MHFYFFADICILEVKDMVTVNDPPRISAKLKNRNVAEWNGFWSKSYQEWYSKRASSKMELFPQSYDVRLIMSPKNS